METAVIYLTEIIQEEDGQYVSYCPELDVASCGDTIDEAYSNIKEAAALHLNVLEELGLREKVFHERGMRCAGTSPPWSLRSTAGSASDEPVVTQYQSPDGGETSRMFQQRGDHRY